MFSKNVSLFFVVLLAGAVQVFAELDPVHAKLFNLVEQGDRLKVKTLLAKGSRIDVNKLNDNNKTVLDIAAECWDVKMAADLLKYNAKVTTIQNLEKLRSLFRSRAMKFFVLGILIIPFFWIGSIIAWDNQCHVELIA